MPIVFVANKMTVNVKVMIGFWNIVVLCKLNCWFEAFVETVCIVALIKEVEWLLRKYVAQLYIILDEKV